MNVHIRILPPSAPGLDVVRGRLERISARLRAPRPPRGRPCKSPGERAASVVERCARALAAPPYKAPPVVLGRKVFNAWDLFRRRA